MSLRIGTLGLVSRYRLAADYGFGADTGTFWMGLRTELVTLLGKSSGLYVAATEADGRPVCWAAFGHCRSDLGLWHYGNLFTHPNQRRLGLAKRVVAHGLLEASRRGARMVTAFVSRHNEASRLTHSKLGFRPTGLIRIVADWPEPPLSKKRSCVDTSSDPSTGGIPQPMPNHSSREFIDAAIASALDSQFRASHAKRNTKIACWVNRTALGLPVVIADRGGTVTVFQLDAAIVEAFVTMGTSLPPESSCIPTPKSRCSFFIASRSPVPIELLSGNADIYDVVAVRLSESSVLHSLESIIQNDAGVVSA